ncbi:allophanate hydrolase subunit 1 [Ruegeria sp. 2012CJ41-6]|uniref:Allophanate hydrolase subunit 1 n=1 Tax=Ruegeria spongiae TaxID=2942209 RepID=A0ABT0PYT8_9RHOB|nr:carboxyltransferase domain-containing protein [Ruegeria spongiae]MCL6282788.1 allophanate hydrolase subunit 1 [Ruegeria spongiae]
MTHADAFPLIRPLGLDGLLVSFADTMSEPANRAALAFRAALLSDLPEGVLETSTSLTSAYLRFDPLVLPHAALQSWLGQLLATQDWYAAPLPAGRRLWRVPTVYGTDLAPQLEEAAALAGLSPQDAVERLSASRVRVLTIGFAPGQPYLGSLGPEFNIPRQQELTPMVPAGALILAISQFVLFSGPAPTGWRHVGQTAFRCFRPERKHSFALAAGDEMIFEAVSPEAFAAIDDRDAGSNGGARVEAIRA